MFKKAEAQKKIKSLIERFDRNIAQYKKTNYDEANTRVDFIDPFFEALGWDVANKQGYAEQYREVVREDKIIIVGKQKAPDYSFRIGGIRKFFVEAKKPSVNLKRDVTPAFQLRRYAYTAKLPLSILTDFEELSVYDTRIKPSIKDTASVSRISYCNYKDYIKEFDFIFDSFSKEAILKGSFDRYVESTKNKRGTSEVDKEFLKLIDEWREKLAKNIAIRNKQLPLDELNFAVQKIIDRIIFLRIAEDRQIEDYGELQILTNGANVYGRLMQIFYHSDRRYDSGLFDFKKDRITPNLTVDDRVIKEIIKSVYYPDSPYEFSVFDVEILGNIYEQFLGKTIRLTPAHLVKVEEKPEVKKAGGVYYTPKYIVDYIVKNTVGELIKKKTPKQIEKIKILDPACGSGSFLLGAYQCLLDYHLNWYSKEEHCKRALKQGKIIQRGKDSYQLSVEEKQKILTNNIFGVDIDSQAVEVSKLSLLLKLLEGETEESTGKLFKYSQIKLLPDLSNNIKCGNSLIGTDYFEGRITGTIDEDEIRKINPFDWKKEFPEIFVQGGFDAVIGNPPYVRIHDISEEAKNYFRKNYISASNQFDLYQLFYEKGLKILRDKGILGFITSNKFCITNYGFPLRDYIVKNYSIINIVDVSNLVVFREASTYPYIFIIRNKSNKKNNVKIYLSENANEFKFIYSENQQKILKGNERVLSVNISGESQTILSKLDMYSVQPILDVYRGRGTSKNLRNERKINTVISITNKQISRYHLNKERFYRLKSAYKNDFAPKLLMKKICYNLEIAIDETGKINPINTVYVIKSDNSQYSLKYVLGILNSKLLNYYARTKYFTTHMKGGYIELRVFEVKKLPIRTVNFSNPKEKKMHDDLVAMVDKMLKFQKKFHSTRLEHDKKLYKTQIDLLDKQIDSLVYKLYELTEEEIKVVEKG